MSETGPWSDLALRLLSGIALAAAGLGAIWIGGNVFITFVSILAGLIVWELTRMLIDPGPDAARFSAFMGLLSAVASSLAIYFPAALAGPALLVPALVAARRIKTWRRVYLTFLVFILLAGFGMMSVRSEFGFIWMLWLILVVAGTDIAGYFAGRLLGGPKFWPRISPKKTWAGTIAGWVVAGVIGGVFMSVTGSGLWLVVLSVATSFASQLGDIAQSAVKRQVGVKDSGTLLPGHGGVFDRFDGMLGASVLVLVVIETTGYPPGPL